MATSTAATSGRGRTAASLKAERLGGLGSAGRLALASQTSRSTLATSIAKSCALFSCCLRHANHCIHKWGKNWNLTQRHPDSQTKVESEGKKTY